MKKILIASIFACAAGIVSAASVDWQFSEQAKNSNTPYDLSAFTAYFFTESVWTTAVAGTVDAATFDKAVDSAALTKTTGGTGANAWTKWATASETWTSESAASGNYYIVIYDGSKYAASTALAGDAYSSAQEAHTPAKWTIGATKAPLAPGDFVSVPEPTSGLLLILGMAGLALKRKRA